MTAPTPRARPGRRTFGGWLRGFDRLSRAAVLLLIALAVLAGVGTVSGLGGEPESIIGPRLQPPGPGWWLGTDNLGRSLLPRLLQGVATTLLLSAIAVAITATLSATLGIFAGYQGGPANEVVTRGVEILYAFPAIVLAILVSAVVGPGRVAAMASIVLVTIPLMTRVVRTAAAAVAQRDYVTAAKISGARLPRLLLSHVLPNVAGTIVVQGTYALSIGILVEGGLSFLGLGVQPPHASLGMLIQQGSVFVVTAPWLVIAPGAVLVAAMLSINVLGDGLRDRLDPREPRALT